MPVVEPKKRIVVLIDGIRIGKLPRNTLELRNAIAIPDSVRPLVPPATLLVVGLLGWLLQYLIPFIINRSTRDIRHADRTRKDHAHGHCAVVVGLEVGKAVDDQIAVRAADRIKDFDLQRIIGSHIRCQRGRDRIELFWLILMIIPVVAVVVPPKPIIRVGRRIHRVGYRRHFGWSEIFLRIFSHFLLLL